MRVSNIPVFSSGNMSGDLTSPVFQVYQVYGWSAQFVFTGAPVGTMSVYASDDPYNPDSSNPQPTNFTLISGSASSISAAGDLMYNYTGSFYNWIKFVYTATSGSGTMNGRLNIKGV